MAISSTALKRNLSRAELALAAVVIAALVAVFMQRMRAIEVAAEEAIVTTRVQDMQARLLGLRLQFMTADAGGRFAALDEVMRQVVGEELIVARRVRSIDWQRVRAGGWVYVSTERKLLYRTLTGDDFPGASGTPATVTFQVQPSFADKQAGAEGAGRLIGARLVRQPARGVAR